MHKFSIRLLYLYLFAFVGLLITVIGIIRLVDLGMKVFIFQGADNYSYYSSSRPLIKDPGVDTMTPEEQAQYDEIERRRVEEDNRKNRQREVSGAISMVLVGIPLYLYHWKTIQKENNS
jgi:hypothetical protein